MARTDIGVTTPAKSPLEPIDAFRDANECDHVGHQLRLIREAAPTFRAWFKATGMPEGIITGDIATAPYPTEYGLFRVGGPKAPFLFIKNRLMVVRWRATDGSPRTLLWEPTEANLAANVPFYANLSAKLPSAVESLARRGITTVEEHLGRLGIRPEEVDYLSFDHLHTQDLRRWLGTTKPQADLSPKRPLAPYFPNAKLLVHAEEMRLLEAVHPIQRPWYQPDTFTDLRRDNIVEFRGDVLLGPGVALLETPGHSTGNHSLALNTDSGIWVSSENAVAAECLVPEHSRIPGVAKTSRKLGQEVILNGNTIETTAEQYNSCMKEKLIADPSRKDPRFPQFYPSSELSWVPLSGARPTFTHGPFRFGRIVRES